MKKTLTAILAVCAASALFAREKWTPAQAASWYAAEPFRAGANFIPSNAINQIEMWSSDTFSPEVIDRELGWAESIGFNAMRVFLSDVVWEREGEQFLKNMDKYLEIADKHGIKTLFVIFDSCWNPESKYGKQPEPMLCKHNPGWVKSPSFEILNDKSRWGMLEKYVKTVVSRFADDPRVFGWDVFNEPGNVGYSLSDKHKSEEDAAFQNSRELLEKVFVWARAANPSQPLTSGPYTFGKERVARAFNSIQLEQSDIISFHCYQSKGLKSRIDEMKKFGRPVICTEYMSRPTSHFDPDLGIMKKEKVAAFNWGLVSGKTQTIYSWKFNTMNATPDMLKEWFHDVFYEGGAPYKKSEADYIKKIMGKK